MKCNMKHITFTALLFFTSQSALGETSPFAGFAGQTIIGGAGSDPYSQYAGQGTGDNGLSNQMTAGMVNHSTPQEDGRVNTEGRESKFDASKNSANAGMIVSLVTGGVMTGTGIPMTMSIIPSVVIAGYALIAKGAQEFAQAGAQAAAAGQNSDGYNLLTKAVETGSGKNAGPNPSAEPANIAERINIPEDVANSMRDKGIDPEQFKLDLAAGKYPDTASVAAAMGADPSILTPENLAQGESIALAEAGKAHAQALQQQGLATQESTTKDSKDAAPGSDGGLGDTYASSSTAQATNLNSPMGIGQPGFLQDPAKFAGKNGSGATGAIGASAFNMEGLGSDAGKKAAGGLDLARLNDGTLYRWGIGKQTSKAHIFQVAHSNYRSYSKWRKSIPAPVKITAKRVASIAR